MKAQKINIEVYVEGMWYGRLRTDIWGGIVPIWQEEITAEVERRLPYVRGKKYQVKLC